MFTGIIEEMGKVDAISKSDGGAKVHIHAPKVSAGLKLGDSICTSGVCLTASRLSHDGFWSDVMNETLHRSTLGSLEVGDYVNLERAVQIGGRLDGHMVTGHIDATCEVLGIAKDGQATRMTFTIPSGLQLFIVQKGSVALDGVSLTVSKRTPNEFEVSVVAHTESNTTLPALKVGQMANLECDILGKYVVSALAAMGGEGADLANDGIRKRQSQHDAEIDMGFLERFGF